MKTNWRNMYTTLFNAITDALEDLRKGDASAAQARLMEAQRVTETMYIDGEPETDRLA